MAALLRLARPLCPPARRSIFTLPDLSALFSDGGAQQTYHERKILPYTPSQLYNIVADVPSYPRFLPFCTAARILGPAPAPAPAPGPSTMQAEMCVGFMSFTERYVSQVTCTPHEAVEVVAASSTPLFRALHTAWRFQPASPQSPHPSSTPPLSGAGAGTPADGPTLVTLDLAFSFASPVHAAVSAAFFGQVSGMMVRAFEERCLDLYGPGKK